MAGRWPLWLNAVLVLANAAGQVRADGGDLRLSEQRGNRRITVLTSPSPLRAGPAEVSVLVQDVQTGKALVDQQIRVRARPSNQPRMQVSVLATTEAATNKLLCVAPLNFSGPGTWHIEVLLPESGEDILAAIEVEVAEPPPAWLEMSLWIGWPAIAVVLFALHQLLVSSRSGRVSRSARVS